MSPARRPRLIEASVVALAVFCACSLSSARIVLAVPLLGADYLGYPVHLNPRLLIASDLTGDGIADLVVVDGDGVATLVAKGDGAFEPQHRVDSIHATAIAVAELTGDRIADIAVLVDDLAELRIYPGRSDGTFGSTTILAGARGTGLVARDLNGDGATDLAATGPASTIWIWIAQRGGAFASPSQYALPAGTGSLFAGDMNRDGRPELFVLRPDGSGFTRLVNDGHGAFDASAVLRPTNGKGLGATGDFNGDGIADLAIPQWTYTDQEGFVDEWLGRADGSFISPIRISSGVRADALMAGDLNGDGFDDLVAITSGGFATHAGSSTGLGPSSRTMLASMAGAPAAIGNLDADGHPDVAALEWSQTGGIPECPFYDGSTVFVWRGDGTGGFAPLPRTALPEMASRLTATNFFDGDGWTDLIVSTTSPPSLVSFRGRGDGGFDRSAELPLAGPAGELRAIDVDGDGRAELVAAVDSLPNYSNLVVFDVGDDGELTRRASIGVGALAIRFDAADFDGDGRLDFAVTRYLGLSVEVDLARDGGTWSRSSIPTIGLRPLAVAAVDVDRDGHPDLVFGATNQFEFDSRLLVYKNNGDGTFALRDSMVTQDPPRALAVADFDEDLNPEIVVGTSHPVSCSDEKAAAYLLRAVDGVLAPLQGPLFMGGSIAAIRLVDLTGDGLADLVTTANRGRVDVRAGLPGGSFGERQEFGVAGGVGDLAILDVNRDGRLDVVVTSGHGFAVLPNLGGKRVDPTDIAARLGGGTGDAILAWGSHRAISLVLAGSRFSYFELLDPSSVRLAGAAPIRGRTRLRDGVSPRVTPDPCVTVSDRTDGQLDLELVFREDEILDGWLRAQAGLRYPDSDAFLASLPFEAKRQYGDRIGGSVCALIVGRPWEHEAAASPSLHSFGVAPSFESGVGVMLDLPYPADHVQVSVYDVAGRRVAALYRGALSAGVHRLTWSGADAILGAPRPGAGIYFARAVVDGRSMDTRILVSH